MIYTYAPQTKLMYEQMNVFFMGRLMFLYTQGQFVFISQLVISPSDILYVFLSVINIIFVFIFMNIIFVFIFIHRIHCILMYLYLCIIYHEGIYIYPFIDLYALIICIVFMFIHKFAIWCVMTDTCRFAYINTYIGIYTDAHVNVCVCTYDFYVYEYIHIYGYICIYINIHIHIYIYVFIYTYMYVYVCTSVYMYMHICIIITIYTYISYLYMYV